MQPDNKSKIAIKQLIILVGAFAVFLLALSVTVVILLNINKKLVKEVNDAVNSSKLYSAADAIKYFKGKELIKGLNSDTYIQQNNPQAIINYKDTKYSYSVNTLTDNSVLFSAKNGKLDDTKTIQSQANEFMKQKGFKVDGYNPSSINDTDYVTYSNNNTICQLSDSQPPTKEGSSSFHIMSCVDKAAITNEYKKIEDLLTIYKASEKVPSFNQIDRFENKEGNIAYDILSFDENDQHHKLLFASVDNIWEYLGDLGIGDPQYANAKYIITPEIKTKISDPKYGIFISSNLQ